MRGEESGEGEEGMRENEVRAGSLSKISFKKIQNPPSTFILRKTHLTLNKHTVDDFISIDIY